MGNLCSIPDSQLLPSIIPFNGLGKWDTQEFAWKRSQVILMHNPALEPLFHPLLEETTPPRSSAEVIRNGTEVLQQQRRRPPTVPAALFTVAKR